MRQRFARLAPGSPRPEFVAAVAYALLGMLWLRAAYPADGPIRSTAQTRAIELTLAAVFAASALAAALRADDCGATRRWARASVAAGVGGLLGGLGLFLLVERVWWDGYSGGCSIGVIYGGAGEVLGADAVCFRPWPLDYLRSQWLWLGFWIAAGLAALLVGRAGIATRRLT